MISVGYKLQRLDRLFTSSFIVEVLNRSGVIFNDKLKYSQQIRENTQEVNNKR